jgi:hypothetical protein
MPAVYHYCLPGTARSSVRPTGPDARLEPHGFSNQMLVRLDFAERIESLVAESIQAIKDFLACMLTDAQAVLNDLRARERVEAELIPRGGPVHDRMPVGRLRWARH